MTMMTREELKKELVKNELGVNVKFTKSDGTERLMKATLNSKHLPVPTEAVKEKKERKKNEDPNFFVVWDLDKDAWRSFNYENVFFIKAISE